MLSKGCVVALIFVGFVLLAGMLEVTVNEQAVVDVNWTDGRVHLFKSAQNVTTESRVHLFASALNVTTESRVHLFVSAQNVTTESRVHLFAATKNLSSGNAIIYRQQARALGYNLTLVELRLRKTSAWFGWRMRVYLAFTRTMPNDTLIVFSDSSDMLLLGTATEFFKEFRAFRVPLVVSCTAAWWPRICPAFNKRPFDKRYGTKKCNNPCGGALAGYRHALETLWGGGLLNFTNQTDDQCWLYEALPKMDKHLWKLDYEGRLFFEHQADPNKIKRVGRRYVVGRGNASYRPVFVHLDAYHPTAESILKRYGKEAIEFGRQHSQ